MAARSAMSLDARITIATHMLLPERPYGQATELARLYQVSRQAVYYLTDKARHALETALTPRSGPTLTGTTLTVTSVRLERAVVTLSLLGVSERDSLIALDELLDTRRSVGYVAQVLRRAAQLAEARDLELTPPLSGLLAADEIFLHAQPILGVVHPASLYLIDLRLTAQRDGDTWGCELREHCTACVRRGGCHGHHQRCWARLGGRCPVGSPRLSCGRLVSSASRRRLGRCPIRTARGSPLCNIWSQPFLPSGRAPAVPSSA